jgi:hypothetical protein
MLDDSGCTMSTRSCVGVGAASASGAASTARVERTIAAQHDSTRDGRQARRSIGTSASAYISCERLSEWPVGCLRVVGLLRQETGLRLYRVHY